MREYSCFCDVQTEAFRGKEVKCLLSNVLGKEERNGWKDGWIDKRRKDELTLNTQVDSSGDVQAVSSAHTHDGLIMACS